MPKGRWKKRKQRDEGAEQRPDQPAAKKQKKSGEWKEWVKENPRYEEYYKVLVRTVNIVLKYGHGATVGRGNDRAQQAEFSSVLTCDRHPIGSD